MNATRPAQSILDDEFLPIRAKLLEIGAALDRIDRAEGGPSISDSRLSQIRDALDVLSGDRRDRAEQIQLIFSLAYDDSWAEEFELSSRR